MPGTKAGWLPSGHFIDSLKIFRLSEHPLIRPHIEGMKSERIKYHDLEVHQASGPEKGCQGQGKDTIVLCEWWRFNSAHLPHFAYVLRACEVLKPHLKQNYSMTS